MGANDVARAAAAFDRGRLRTARELRGRSQSEVAQAVGVTPTAISQFENGHSRPAGATLTRLADHLDVPVRFFESRGPAVEEEPAAFFRSLRRTTVGQRRKNVAAISLLHDLVEAIEERVTLPDVRVPRLDHLTDGDDIEKAASEARESMGLSPDGPVANVVLAMERHGVVVARYQVMADTVDAFSVRYRRPVVVLGTDKRLRDRSRFDAAHELGHLVLGHGVDHVGTKEAEAQAHRFAAAFLMPANSIRVALPARADWSALVSLKAHWQVSIAALLKRAHTLEVISTTTYTQAMKTMSIRGWRRDEPGNLGAPERPVLLGEAVRVAQENGTTLSDLADEAGLPLSDLERLLVDSAAGAPRVSI